jgi:hypothetical protein
MRLINRGDHIMLSWQTASGAFFRFALKGTLMKKSIVSQSKIALSTGTTR